jgi:flagellar biogenesis protein FliO
LVLVAVGEEQLLIGVGPAGIRHLHTLANPVEGSKRQGSFAQVLSAVKIDKNKERHRDCASEDCASEDRADE